MEGRVGGWQLLECCRHSTELLEVSPFLARVGVGSAPPSWPGPPGHWHATLIERQRAAGPPQSGAGPVLLLLQVLPPVCVRLAWPVPPICIAAAPCSRSIPARPPATGPWVGRSPPRPPVWVGRSRGLWQQVGVVLVRLAHAPSPPHMGRQGQAKANTPTPTSPQAAERNVQQRGAHARPHGHGSGHLQQLDTVSTTTVSEGGGRPKAQAIDTTDSARARQPGARHSAPECECIRCAGDPHGVRQQLVCRLHERWLLDPLGSTQPGWAGWEVTE